MPPRTTKVVSVTAASTRPVRAVPKAIAAAKVTQIKKNGGVPKKRGRPVGSINKSKVQVVIPEAVKGKRGRKPGGKLKNAPKPIKVFNDELKSKGLEYTVEKLVDSRITKKGVRQYLVKWVGWPSTASTWEPEVHLRNSQDKIAQFDEQNPDAA